MLACASGRRFLVDSGRKLGTEPCKRVSACAQVPCPRPVLNAGDCGGKAGAVCNRVVSIEALTSATCSCPNGWGNYGCQVRCGACGGVEGCGVSNTVLPCLLAVLTSRQGSNCLQTGGSVLGEHATHVTHYDQRMISETSVMYGMCCTASCTAGRRTERERQRAAAVQRGEGAVAVLQGHGTCCRCAQYCMYIYMYIQHGSTCVDPATLCTCWHPQHRSPPSSIGFHRPSHTCCAVSRSQHHCLALFYCRRCHLPAKGHASRR